MILLHLPDFQCHDFWMHFRFPLKSYRAVTQPQSRHVHLHFKQTLSFPSLSRLKYCYVRGRDVVASYSCQAYLIRAIKNPICFRQAGTKTRTDEKAKYGIVQKTICYIAISGLGTVNTANSKTTVMDEKEFCVFCPAQPTPNRGQRQMTQHFSHEQWNIAILCFSSASTILAKIIPQSSSSGK